LESTKGFKITLGTCIDVNKRKCSYLSYLSLVLFIKGGFLCHVFAYKTGVGFNVLPFTGNMHEVLRDYRNVSCLSVCPSICLYVTLHAQAYLLTHWCITIKLGTHVVLIEPMCSDLDLGSYIKGQGHTRHLKVRVHMHMSDL